VTKWLDSRRAWQFALIYGCLVLMAVMPGGGLIDHLTGRSGPFLTAAIVVTIGSTAGATWARQFRLRRLPSQQRAGTPGPMRPYQVPKPSLADSQENEVREVQQG
jgi:hypothetical protein